MKYNCLNSSHRLKDTVEGAVLKSIPPSKMKEVLLRLCNREQDFRDIPAIDGRLKKCLSNDKENQQPPANAESAGKWFINKIIISYTDIFR